MTQATLRPDGWPQATPVGYVNDGLTSTFMRARQPEGKEPGADDRISLTIDHDTADLMAITGLSMARTRARWMIGPKQKVLRMLR